MIISGRVVRRGAALCSGQRRRLMHARPAALLSQPLTVSVVGAPLCFGQQLDGADKAPAALRGAGALRKLITSLGWRWTDRGDVAVPAAGRGEPPSVVVGRANERLCAVTAAAAGDGHFVLTLGGDHSVAIGSIAGLLRARPSLGVIWVDAHADINAPDTSPSGNIHGMPVSFLMRLIDVGAVPGCAWMAGAAQPVLSPQSLCYVGLRDLDPGEKRAIKAFGIKAFTMHDVDRLGIGKVMEMALDHLAGCAERPLHVSFDIDAVDPAVTPATGTAVPGGLSYREAHYVVEEAARSGLLGSLDVVEVNPDLAPGAGAAATVQVALELIGSALGKDILDDDDDDAEQPPRGVAGAGASGSPQ